MTWLTLRKVAYGTLIMVGGVAVSLVLFVIAYAIVLFMAAGFGKGAVVEWDNAVPPSLGGRNAARIYQEGVVTDKGCNFSLRLASNPWGYRTVARTVWSDREKCERVVEVFNVR